MTVRNLQHLIRPKSVALIGASDRPGSIGAVVARNLQDSGFAGEVWPVNTRPQIVGGVPSVRDVAALSGTPEPCRR